MDYAIGIGLALVVSGSAALVGFDRDHLEMPIDATGQVVFRAFALIRIEAMDPDADGVIANVKL
jgi:hypothetical protein